VRLAAAIFYFRGCGAGNNTVKLSQYVSGFDCDLVDLSLPMLEKACDRISMVCTGKIRSFQGDFREIDLPAQGYDVILAAAVLHHLRDDQDWEATLKIPVLPRLVPSKPAKNSRSIGFLEGNIINAPAVFAAKTSFHYCYFAPGILLTYAAYRHR